MTDSPATNSIRQADFELILKEVQRNSVVVEQVEAVSREVENIRLLSQAISDVGTQRVGTFVTA
jgi:hypothetical protein